MLPLFSLTLLCSALPDLPVQWNKAVWEKDVLLWLSTESFLVSVFAITRTTVQSLKEWLFASLGDTWVLLVENGFFWNCSIVTNRPFLNSSFQLILCYFSDFHCICNKTWKLLTYRETLCITDNFLALLLNFQPLHIPVLEDASSRLIPKQLVHVLYWLEESKFVSLTCI